MTQLVNPDLTEGYTFACKQGEDVEVKWLGPGADLLEIQMGFEEFLRGAGWNRNVKVYISVEE